MNEAAPYILLDDQMTHRLRYYTDPVDLVVAREAKEVEGAFARLMAYHAQGYYLAGYLSYELGFALEPKLAPLMPENRESPLLQFGVFESVSNDVPADHLYTSRAVNLDLKPAWTQANYSARFKRVMDYIRAGDVYQINLTFPMHAAYDGPAKTLYAAFRHRQKGRYGGIVSLRNGPEIISLSPELFFRKEGHEMSMRPMKGTRPRALNQAEDTRIAEDMRAEAKSQAENLMIVDLLRNDLSRISKPGSVQVPELFALETYPTLHQMTSRVTSRLKAGTDFADIFKSLFPCGSVTGAPKIRAMEIIDELEDTPRGAYCGSLGYIDPGGEACFNVCIRTLILDGGKLRYSVGSGLVLDSGAADEYAECLLKADVVRPQESYLIETLRWDAATGFVRLSRHKKRMQKAARTLGYKFSSKRFDLTLQKVSAMTAQRVRLSLSKDGKFTLQHSDYVAATDLKLSLSKHPLTPDVQMTGHKISARQFYDGEQGRVNALTGADEVLFLNTKHELCEGSYTSLFLEKNGQLLTSALSSGILPGILREELVETGKAKEAILTLSDLLCADKVFLGNSLRGLVPATLMSPKPV